MVHIKFYIFQGIKIVMWFKILKVMIVYTLLNTKKIISKKKKDKKK